jgi:antitoxin (DNA-binding transcriptional repressor) of toxin-antitoxin stability system
MLIAELNKRGKLIVTVVPIPQREREYRERKTKKRKPGRFLG